jgi:hypothetical protein
MSFFCVYTNKKDFSLIVMNLNGCFVIFRKGRIGRRSNGIKPIENLNGRAGRDTRE